MVLGPTEDGGYYLVAMRTPHDVFTGVETSTAHVLADTCQKAAAAGLHVHRLPVSFDIDNERDLSRLRALLADGSAAPRLPATAALLREWNYPSP